MRHSIFILFLFLAIPINNLMGQTEVINPIQNSPQNKIKQAIDTAAMAKQIIEQAKLKAHNDNKNVIDIQLPPISYFFENIEKHPSIKIFDADTDEAKAKLAEIKLEWLNYISVSGNYQYGMSNAYNTNINPDAVSDYLSNSARTSYAAGVVVGFPLGSFLQKKQRIKQSRASIMRIEYEKEEAVENRKLLILNAYNLVKSGITVMKARSDAAVIYQAQMSMSEQDFINGNITIGELSYEKGSASEAIVKYQMSRTDLQNSILLLEMLSGKKISYTK